MSFPGQSRRSQAGLVVCERGNRWAVAMRRLFAAKFRVYETRTLGECERQLAVWPHGVAAMEWNPRVADELPGWIWSVKRRWPKCRLVVLGATAQQPGYWAVREAGAEDVGSSNGDLMRLGNWVSRQLEEAPLRRFETMQDDVHAGLPWSGYRA